MNYKEIRGNLLRILLLGLSLSLVESLNIECEHERYQFCFNSESKTVKECSSCNIYEAQLLEMVGEAVVITSDNNSENFKVERLSFEEGTLNYTPMTEILRSFPNLKHLSFSSTIIPNINEEMLGNLSQLDSFEISSVQFKIALMSFSSAVNLQSLSIIRNDNSKFSNYCFYGLQNLISLSLTEDNLKQVDNFWFLEMQKLEQLDLSYNQVKMLEDYVFEELKSLLYLNLAYNEIENISKKLFQFNINLKSINLRHNKIYSIQIGSFGNLRNLNFLILEANVCVNKKFITEELPNIEGALDDCHVVLTTTEEPGDSCEVPDIPNGRIWGSEGGVSKYLQVVGSSYTDLDPVQVKCDDGFYFPQKAESDNKIFCKENKWTKPFHECLKLCSKEGIYGFTTIPTCKRLGVSVTCDDDKLFHGTIVNLACKIGYKVPTNIHVDETLICKQNGKWDHTPFECEVQCGFITPEAVPRMFLGQDASINEFPWHVGIYRDGGHICGGSIISKKIVISAAHCFHDESEMSAAKLQEKIFQVAAGKTQRNLTVEENRDVQIRNVHKIIMEDAYNGKTGYFVSDIALVIVQENFLYLSHIAPVCLKFGQYSTDKYPASGTKGTVPGWGLTADGNPSEKLQKIELPVIEFATCKAEAPQNFKDFVIGDKICAGFKSEIVKIGVCSGDSGGGLVIPQIFGTKDIFYLHGLVSNSRADQGQCDFKFYTLFTNIHEYVDFIQKAQVDYP